MPRHAVDSCPSTCPAEAHLQINKRFSGLEIVENEFALPAERPSLKDLASLRVDRNGPGLLRLGCKDIQNALFEIHVGPAEGKNLSSPQPRIQSESNHVLNVRCRIPEKLSLLVRTHNPHANVQFPKELHFAHRIDVAEKFPIDCDIEHTLEQSQLPVHGRTGDFLPTVELVALNLGRSDLREFAF